MMEFNTHLAGGRSGGLWIDVHQLTQELGRCYGDLSYVRAKSNASREEMEKDSIQNDLQTWG